MPGGRTEDEKLRIQKTGVRGQKTEDRGLKPQNIEQGISNVEGCRAEEQKVWR